MSIVHHGHLTRTTSHGKYLRNYNETYFFRQTCRPTNRQALLLLKYFRILGAVANFWLAAKKVGWQFFFIIFFFLQNFYVFDKFAEGNSRSWRLQTLVGNPPRGYPENWKAGSSRVKRWSRPPLTWLSKIIFWHTTSPCYHQNNFDSKKIIDTIHLLKQKINFLLNQIL